VTKVSGALSICFVADSCAEGGGDSNSVILIPEVDNSGTEVTIDVVTFGCVMALFLQL
jgi:hypothetical protein